MKDRWEESIFRMAAREQIMLPRRMSDRIEEILCKPKNRAFRMNWRKSIVLAAAMIMLVSATAVASAGALRERMEAMNREKLETYFTQIYASKTGADNYNRAYFDTEKERMRALREVYEGEARFPEKELTMIEEASEYKGRGVAFLGDTSTFFFPEKEMSDEELLEIIDFMHKRDYSLQKMNEMIETGEVQQPQLHEEEVQATGEEILATDAVYEPTQSLTIPYTGDLELDLTIAAGRNELFLAGYNSVHRMEIGSSDSEVFFDDFDEETLTTINKFFENSLNVSETSRQLFIHRNTLVYRLDKLQKATGLDLRVFEDAITFKIALMVVKYMKYMETFDY